MTLTGCQYFLMRFEAILEPRVTSSLNLCLGDSTRWNIEVSFCHSLENSFCSKFQKESSVSNWINMSKSRIFHLFAVLPFCFGESQLGKRNLKFKFWIWRKNIVKETRKNYHFPFNTSSRCEDEGGKTFEITVLGNFFDEKVVKNCV